MPCSADSHHDCPISGAERAFRTRIAAQIELADAFIAEHRATDEQKAALTGVTLGTFAGGRIDPSRFGSLLSSTRSVDPTTLDRVEQAAASLVALAARVGELVRVDAAPGATLRDTVAAAFAAIGRVYGAARVIELARTDRYRENEHGRLLTGLPFDQWSRAEREVAPWIRVKIAGSDVQAAGLAEFLDGGVKIIVKPLGACAPAPLARLVSPDVYVAQVTGKADLDGFKSFDGPAVALFAPEGTARFTHDPRRGARSWERLQVDDLPRAPRRSVGGASAFQMGQDLALLVELATPPSVRAATAAAQSAPVDPADKLATWLLDQAGLLGAPPA